MLVCDRCIMYKLLIDPVPLVSVLFAGVNVLTAFIPTFAGRADPPAASGTSDNAAPAFVQLGVVGADVVPYIP